MQRTPALLAAALLALGPVSTAGANPASPAAPPPAAPAPAATPGSDQDLTALLAEARHEVLEARRELREADARLAKASRDGRRDGAKRMRLLERQERAQEAFDAARSRVPALVAQARAAGVSASTLRAYEHSLYAE